MNIGIVGYGKVGQAYHKVFPETWIHDPYYGEDSFIPSFVERMVNQKTFNEYCDVALICVPTDLNSDNELDMSIVEKTVHWLDVDLIIIKSALQPGTTIRLMESTGKNITVSVELIGEGSYYVPPWKYPDTCDPGMHDYLIVGSCEEQFAERAAEILWSRMSPDVKIHITTSTEAEIIKLVENAYGALKVTWSNCIKSLADKADQSFIRIHQGWTQDGRVDAMHTRVISDDRGWDSKCWNKDIIALQTYAKKQDCPDLVDMISTVLRANELHKGT